jgi:hypothetical protein
MKLLFGVIVLIQAIFSVLAQESINAHEGFDVGMQAGIALAICFSILGSFAVTVNIIKRKCVKSIP